MIAAILNENNIVINRVVVNSLSDLPGSVNGSNCEIGDTYDQVNNLFFKSAERLNEIQTQKNEIERIIGIFQAVQNDVALNQIKTMSASQIDTYFTNNVTTLNDVIALLKRIVKILARNL